MGLALGLTLGGIAFVRGVATPDDTRAGPEREDKPFTVTVPSQAPIGKDDRGDYSLPTDTPVLRAVDKPTRVRLPKDASLPEPVASESKLVYTFPAKCELRTEAVSRVNLGLVIALSVLGICLWGTLIGSMLPLIFRRFNMDPAVASGPFVATFVDVTGIFIFFSIAQWLLLSSTI